MKILKSQELFPNIFLVQDDEIGVVYSPLLGKFFTANSDGLRIIKKFLEENKPADHHFFSFLKENGFFEKVELPRTAKSGEFKPKDLTISITSSCNLRCIYCYASGGEDFVDLKWGQITTAIKKMYHNAKENDERNVELSFHGTGESLNRWTTLQRTVSYARESLPKDWDIDFALVTNGTLIDNNKAKFLAKHKFSVVLSIDGLAKVQNKLRPKATGEGSFKDAINGAKELVKEKVPFAMRSTITGLNQEDILEFVKLCSSIECKEISVAPFSLTGRGETGVEDIEPKKFIRHYIEAKKLAKQLDVDFSMPSDYLDNVSARYCNADGELMAIMPEGLVTCCTRVTRSADELGDLFFVGNVSDTQIVINQKKVEKLKDFNLYNFHECKNCFAKFTCSGGCHHTRLINGGKQPKNYCETMQGILWDTLKTSALAGSI